MSFNDCISIDRQAELLRLRDALDLVHWRVGDLANQSYEDRKDQYSFAYTCNAVGFFVGKSGATIQRWARAAAFYSKEWRDKYSGLLSFEHYAYAMQCKDWQDKLERAAYGGVNEQPMSVSQMAAETFSPDQEETPDNFPWPVEVTMEYDSEIPSVKITGIPENGIQAILTLIRKLAEKLGLTDERLDKVNQALQLLREAMEGVCCGE
jgi:hypothetical protein